MISHEKKIVFVHVPKTGGKSFSNFLRPYCDEESLKFSPFKHEGNLHATVNEYMRAYGDNILEEYTFVSIIRNPWEKALSHSLHHNKGEFDREHFRNLIFNPFRYGFWPSSHFHFYLKLPSLGVCRDGTPALPPNYMAQTTAVGMQYARQNLLFPHIIRFERFADDASKFLDNHGIVYEYEDLKRKTNTTNHKHYSHYFENDEIREIGRTCALDIQIYGFTFDDRREK